MAIVEGHALLQAISSGQLAVTIAEHASLFGPDVLNEKVRDGVLTIKAHRRCTHNMRVPIESDGDSSDEEDLDFQVLRRKAKEESQSVFANRCLPSDAAQMPKRTGPFSSLLILQEAIEVLQELLLQPTEPVMLVEIPPWKELEADVLPLAMPVATDPPQNLDVTPSTIRPTRPCSAKSLTSRPRSRAGCRAVAPPWTAEIASLAPVFLLGDRPELPPKPPNSHRLLKLPSDAQSNKAETCTAPDGPVRPASLSALPPLKTPRRGAQLELGRISPTKALSISAMELDLGFGGDVASGPPRSLTQREPGPVDSLWSPGDSPALCKQAPYITLPPLASAPVPTSFTMQQTTGLVSLGGTTLQGDSWRLIY